MLLGIISDTHGLIRPEAVAALRGSDLIIHAGDVGNRIVLDELREIAPVFAVRGNVDTQPWAKTLPDSGLVVAAGRKLYVLHELSRLAVDPARAGFAVVVFGHSHKPSCETKGSVIFLNPGSAGPRRFRLPVSVAHVRLSNKFVRPELIPLSIT